MWYKAAEPYVESGELAILGVVQEQHAERAQLYQQWKQYDFTIIQDANTQLGLSAVPIPLLIDEHGVVRSNRPRPNQLEAFMKEEFSPSTEEPATKPQPTEFSKLMDEGNGLINSRQTQAIDQAIKTFEKAVQLEPENGQAAFSLGVAYRRRFDSDFSKASDFENASKYWSRALAINPNQYIWRRRIEQYGPRQIKPYPFYNWIDQAKKEITKRGEKPIELRVALTGSELATPSRTFTSQQEQPKNPDPESKINAGGDKISLTATAVPAAVKPGRTVRVHLHLELSAGKWNNEATPMKIWINDESNGVSESQLIEYQGPATPSSTENRFVDFEFKTDPKSSQCKITGYVLFHSCTEDGVCYYNRKDFEVPVELK